MEPLNVAANMTTNPAQHIVMLNVNADLTNQQNNCFLTTALALTKCGYRVTIIAGLAFSEEKNTDLKHFDVRRSGTWLPTNIFGYFERFMSVFRALYVALRFVALPPTPNPLVIITDSSSIALPIYRCLGKYKIIYLPDATEQWMYEHTITAAFQTKCLKFADEILGTGNSSLVLPNHNLKRYFPNVDLNLARLNEQHDLTNIIPGLTSRTNLFVAFGAFHPENNLELALVSFTRALLELPDMLVKKTHLVIGGLPSKKTIITYHKELCTIAKLCKFENNITILQNIDVHLKKALIKSSIAVINTSKQYISTISVLEGMYMGKTVISVNSVFVKKVLLNEITGFILKTDPVLFANIIKKLVSNRLIAVYIGNLAKTDFKYKFSFKMYAQILTEIITNHSIKFCCPEHCNEHPEGEHITFESYMNNR